MAVAGRKFRIRADGDKYATEIVLQGFNSNLTMLETSDNRGTTPNPN